MSSLCRREIEPDCGSSAGRERRVNIGTLRQERQLELADDEECGALAFDDAQLGMRRKGFGVERRYATETPPYAPLVQSSIDRVPKSCQRSAEAKPGFDVYVEVPHRLVRSLEDVGATNFILLILIGPDPEEARELLLDEGAIAGRTTREPPPYDRVGPG